MTSVIKITILMMGLSFIIGMAVSFLLKFIIWLILYSEKLSNPIYRKKLKRLHKFKVLRKEKQKYILRTLEKKSGNQLFNFNRGQSEINKQTSINDYYNGDN